MINQTSNLFEHDKAPKSDAEKLAWLRLIRTETVGPITFYNLLETFGTAQKALEALPTLAKRGGRLRGLTLADEGACLKEMDALQKRGGQFLFADEKSYPLALSALEDAPPILSVLGNPKLLNCAGVGIVGARNASLNGQKFAHKLAQELGHEQQIIISGLARGIDTAAHDGALATGTIAVVAGGVNIIYPPENKSLYEKIIFDGCVVAESPFGMEPLARHFPKRNRIISGLSAGVVVVEATVQSGSLITARMAAEQGRDVYAVPGHPFDPRAAGPNKLIQDGAILVQSAQDVLKNLSGFHGSLASFEEMPATPWQAAPIDGPEGEEARALILQNISMAPVTVDELVRNCHLTIPQAQMILLELELAGRLQRLPGNRIVLIN